MITNFQRKRYSFLSFLFFSSGLLSYPLPCLSYFSQSNPFTIGQRHIFCNSEVYNKPCKVNHKHFSQSPLSFLSSRSGSSSALFSTYTSISAEPGSMEREIQNPSKNPLNEQSCVLIVGASRGIGLEFAKQCLSKGTV